MMKLDFEEITTERQADYLKILDLCVGKTSDYSFINLWGWADEYGIRWAWDEDVVWIKQTVPQEKYWAPVGRWETTDWKKSFEMLFDGKIVFERVPEKLLNIWLETDGIRIEKEEARDQWDYIYSTHELIELKGNRFHKKKNLLNQFKKKYAYDFKSFGPELVHTALSMQEDWCTWRDCEAVETLAAENRVISKILGAWKELEHIQGGAIMVDQKMAAYTISEAYTEDMILIHFEKGQPEYKGVYQAINQIYLGHHAGNLQNVNREQDLGNEGLRKAKLSYNPSGFQKKFRVTLNS